MAKSLAQIIAAMSDEERIEVLAGLDPDALQWDWSFWGRPEQQRPEGDEVHRIDQQFAELERRHAASTGTTRSNCPRTAAGVQAGATNSRLPRRESSICCGASPRTASSIARWRRQASR